MADLQLDFEDDEPTKPVCKECDGKGHVLIETKTEYRQQNCGWCGGTGRRTVSGQVPKQ